MSTNISLINVKKYYKKEPHQIEAVEYLGNLLLKTPAATKLKLIKSSDWIEATEADLSWLELQLSKPTLDKFIALWRTNLFQQNTQKAEDLSIKYFSQRDNVQSWAISCSSSSHSMYVDFILRKNNKGQLVNDNEFVTRVYSNKYGKYANNNSASWDIVHNVCKSFGVKCKYSNAGKKALLEELDKTKITCVNIYHKGLTKSFRAGGHIIVIVDYDKTKGFLIYDPWGTKPSTNYSDKHKGIYWMPEIEFDWRWQGIFTQFNSLV